MKFIDYDPNKLEPEILKFWQENEVTEFLRKRNKKGKKFYFLQGPPYTSGHIHLGHAWNMGLKDMVLRYKRMQGFNVWDRMGYDMHGLPTEQKTMAKLGLKNKEDIEKFTVKKFMEECYKFCTEMMVRMDKDFQRLGATLDFRDPYQPIKNEFMEAEWWLIQQAHKKKRLYQGLRTMHWDSATQTAVAKHELEYKNVKDTSIYVKFKLEGEKKKYFIIWTTTPWTIPLNLAVMVNPELDYVDAQVGDETWVLGEKLVDKVMEKAGVEEFKILKKFKGSKLEGKRYQHPLDVKKYLPKKLQENPRLFSVLLTKEYVDDSAGTGLVHSAPGCGPEDYEVGHDNGIPPFNCVDEEGFFDDFGPFTGWKAKTDDPKFIQAIKDSGSLVAKEAYVHEYPHGERSHEPVIFRTTKQWFFKVEDLKKKMIEANSKIYWNPQSAKNAFDSWLENLRDNSITKQRYWGTPVPIWQAKDGDYIVVGSLAELEKLSGQKVKEMHIPEIDKIIIKKDGKEYKRVPDVLDVWIDAGTTSWNCLNYPREKKDFEKFFPADFILEGKDQIRGWFNLLMVASMLALEKPSFQNVYMNGFVTDVSGVKMSKSLGNIISPDELIEKYGADVLRYYMFQTNAGEDINFSWEECKTKSRLLLVLWNTHKLLLNLCRENKINPVKLKKVKFGLEEKYMLSRLNSTIKKVTWLMEKYRLDEVTAPLEELFLELSRTYIQMVRDKSSLGNKEEKESCVYVIFTVMIELLKMFSTVSPFISEGIYQNFREEFSLQEKSIAHHSWPKADNKMIDEKLEQQMVHAGNIIQASLGAREKANLGLRWPVKEILVMSSDEKVGKTVKDLQEIIRRQTNSKSVKVVKILKGLKSSLKANHSKIGPVYGKSSPDVVKRLLSEDAEKVVSAIEKKGKYEFTLQGKKINITADMIVVEKEVPEMYKEAEFRNGSVYLDVERNPELEAEGYARELMRSVQNGRKEAGLEKSDRINLFVKVSPEMEKMLSKFSSEIKEKVGAEMMEFSLGKGTHSANFKVKKEEFKIWFDKV